MHCHGFPVVMMTFENTKPQRLENLHVMKDSEFPTLFLKTIHLYMDDIKCVATF